MTQQKDAELEAALQSAEKEGATVIRPYTSDEEFARGMIKAGFPADVVNEWLNDQRAAE